MHRPIFNKNPKLNFHNIHKNSLSKYQQSVSYEALFSYPILEATVILGIAKILEYSATEG